MTEVKAFDAAPKVASALELDESSVRAVIGLFDEGATVPFIARYRKEATSGLDEVQIRAIQDQRAYVLELESRRETILTSIESQGKLTDELKKKILSCETKSTLEDLYLPYKPKRRTRATIAREKGLEPLAQRILDQPDQGDPEAEASEFIDEEKGVADKEAALKGARDIVAEAVSENADVRSLLRKEMETRGKLKAEATAEAKEKPTKYEQYYEFDEHVATIPSHRFLAVRRGEREGMLKTKLDIQSEPILERMSSIMGHRDGSPFADQMGLAIEDGYKRLVAPSVESDVRVDLKMRADTSAVEVFADNLRNLLLASPLGQRSVIGIDPGIRTGCKCAVVDNTGKFLDHLTIYPGQGAEKTEKARRDFIALAKKHTPFAIGVGNGTGGRETEAFVKDALKQEGLKDTIIVTVNEAGASVYSASEIARDEFPDLDLTVRGAISIARRLQDPLAELVKIEPKAIGVGQYQHDVFHVLLQKKLEEVVESCVNHVGVELNTASPSLLSYVAGIGPSLAKKIVAHREEQGAFSARSQLMKVKGLGPHAFEQCAGFLRVTGGENPLDGSAVHPERYDLVEHIAQDMNVSLDQLVGSEDLAKSIQISRYLSDAVGEPTLRDIIEELKKPGRDPRATFELPKFRDDIQNLEDLKPGLVLEGVVTNVTAFGAFVDIGVHQDGLVHISKLADRFIKDPKEVVKVGQLIKVRVLDVDLERRRISLSARSENPQGQKKPHRKDQQGRKGGKPRGKGPQNKFSNNPFAQFFGNNSK